MRRVTITISAALMLAAFAPASALARHHHRSGRHHVRHARIERFGSNVTTAAATGSSADNAGTVQSFKNDVLTIMLNNRSTVSGTLTNDTELRCMAPAQDQTVHEDGDGGSGDQSGDGDSSGSGDNQTQPSGDQSSGREQGDAAEQEDQAAEQNENEAENSCSTANLTPGTVVHEAELRLSSSRAVWAKVELES